MRMLSWNCRGLGGPSTISQLKESIRLNLPELIFICETKQNRGFVETVCKRLKFGTRWAVNEPVGRKGGIMVAWATNVEIKHLWKNDFCVEMLVA